jgi:hypothetical protein
VHRSVFSPFLVTISFGSSSKPPQEEIQIPRRPTTKSLESLNLTLQQLEQSGDPDQDDASITELKRVLLNRIADLELSKTLETDDNSDKDPKFTNLASLASATQDTTFEEDIDRTAIDKLD